ncbi:MAG: DegT/DnrJ/EryC1/StrS family aminotransferase [Coriobacteriales bacterium]|jgi:dTDP-4-amino-4,6-dideoxygalactose transaminase|nr:DegT/DnrJ/EryC1/StrS family aminotransferase [Coriobacteriales bacterium]
MIRLIRPYISFTEVATELEEILDSGILTKGPYSKQLPALAQAYTGASHAFLTTSATTALTMCLKHLEVGPGDEVVLSDFSFPATANVVEDLGAVPVFADVSPDTFNMTAEALESRISSKTKAVIFVDAAGNPSGLERIKAVCNERSIALVEDAACALGSSVGKRKVGTIADFTCFSLHPRKLLTGGEGGIIATNNDDAAKELRLKLSHGADETMDFVTFGYNYRMPEISCLLACKQFEKLDTIIAERQTQMAEYTRLLEPLGFKAQLVEPGHVHNVQSVVFKVPKGVSRPILSAQLKQHSIETTLGTYCLSACSYYREKYNDVQPVAYALQETTICLPCYSGVPVAEICDAIANSLR